MRDNNLLEKKLDQIWAKNFSDVPRTRGVNIFFGRKAMKRLGSIREKECEKPKQTKTKILINGYFRDKTIPDFVIDATIAHELCHYVHGFGSPLPQMCRYPHRGGKVDREMETRGLTMLAEKEDRWLSKNWFKYLNNNTM